MAAETQEVRDRGGTREQRRNGRRGSPFCCPGVADETRLFADVGSSYLSRVRRPLAIPAEMWSYPRLRSRGTVRHRDTHGAAQRT